MQELKNISTIKKRKKKYDKIVLLAKCNFTLKALIDSVISHEEFVSINNVLKDYEEMKEETKFKDLIKFCLFIKQSYHIVWNVEKIQKEKIQKFQGQKTDELCFYQNVQFMIIEKSKFTKQQEVSGLLSSLEIKTPLCKIPLVDPL